MQREYPRNQHQPPTEALFASLIAVNLPTQIPFPFVLDIKKYDSHLIEQLANDEHVLKSPGKIIKIIFKKQVKEKHKQKEN